MWSKASHQSCLSPKHRAWSCSNNIWLLKGKKHSSCDSLDQLRRTEPLSSFISNDNLSSWVQKITQLHSMNWEGDEGEGGAWAPIPWWNACHSRRDPIHERNESSLDHLCFRCELKLKIKGKLKFDITAVGSGVVLIRHRQV